MLDRVWQVYTEGGTYLGLFRTLMGNNILMVDAETAEKLCIGDILHIDETHSQEAWKVRVTGNHHDRPTEFTFEKLFDRIEIYPDREVEIKVTSYNFFERKSNMWLRLIEYVFHSQAVRVVAWALPLLLIALVLILKYLC